MSDETLINHPEAKPVLDYPCGEAPPAGLAREVAPGILWLRMPLPFALNHINLWAARDGVGPRSTAACNPAKPQRRGAPYLDAAERWNRAA